jgi:hypothetical protein
MSPSLFFTIAAAVLLLFPIQVQGQAQTQAAPRPLPNQGETAPSIPLTAASTPPGGDTVGYWQQQADYQIVATLDDARGTIRAAGTMRYTNNSPDTLTELWVHQHLNAFRPRSRWSDTDAQEGRTRFQPLQDPDYGYERFTTAPRIAGRTVTPEYPLAPDSTVVRLALPSPLYPGSSVDVHFAWDARPSTLPRRQGRRGRSVDFAQWYPRIAVYDRHGWKPNALVPAGEFYGEFGHFDVTLIIADDQVVGATGVPVSGDPGWSRVAVPGSRPIAQANAYATIGLPFDAPQLSVPSGMRAVRFVARDVHHFAWSASPGFRYEGGAYVRGTTLGAYRFPLWDTVAVHVLYRGDAESDCEVAVAPLADTRRPRARPRCIASAKTQWENGRALGFAMASLRWLEEAFGPYAYPQMTVLKRLDGGGTEFPMMMQNGSASQGLITHEGGHIYAHGILANNEWQSGWMDEGLTSYQTRWQVRGARGPVSVEGAEPIGLRADLFRNFATYNRMVYDRAEAMYDALHDAIGDAAFRDFLRDYYARWAFRHVDRWAMQASAERASGKPLEWFFHQWVHEVGEIAYDIGQPEVTRHGDGWRTAVTLKRTGAYRHPMPVGVRTSQGWTTVRGDATRDEHTLVIETPERPNAVWLDPDATTQAVRREAQRVTVSPSSEASR